VDIEVYEMKVCQILAAFPFTVVAKRKKVYHEIQPPPPKKKKIVL
jgi:hypothetical protein